MRVKVRNGYVFFQGPNAHPGGSVIDITEAEYEQQSWKVERVTETKMIDKITVLNRALKEPQRSK